MGLGKSCGAGRLKLCLHNRANYSVNIFLNIFVFCTSMQPIVF
uniref:Uncharacterized protein n=1 Tax=Anguilla anguilla TaxID=7936 RepID=A0A0E9Q5U7_ANGAN